MVLLLVGNEVKVVESVSISIPSPPIPYCSNTNVMPSFLPMYLTYVRLMGVNGSGYPIAVSVGRVLYKYPVQLWEIGKQASFETTITLQMTTANASADGHGMTFFIVPVNSTISTGGDRDNLGIYNAFSQLNSISLVETSIRTTNTLGITSTLKGPRICVTARITYDVPTKKINVVATYGSTTATVSFVFNLAALLPKQVQVGLSASTGNWLAYFDAYTWHFNSTMGPHPYGIRNNDAHIKQYVMSSTHNTPSTTLSVRIIILRNNNLIFKNSSYLALKKQRKNRASIISQAHLPNDASYQGDSNESFVFSGETSPKNYRAPLRFISSLMPCLPCLAIQGISFRNHGVVILVSIASTTVVMKLLQNPRFWKRVILLFKGKHKCVKEKPEESKKHQ